MDSIGNSDRSVLYAALAVSFLLRSTLHPRIRQDKREMGNHGERSERKIRTMVFSTLHFPISVSDHVGSSMYTIAVLVV